MKAIYFISYPISFSTITLTTPLPTVVQPTACKDANTSRRLDTSKHTPARRQVPEWESPDVEYRCGHGATNPPSRDVITAAGKMLNMAAAKTLTKPIYVQTHADYTNITIHNSASIVYCGGSLGSRMYCETIAQMAPHLTSKCATPDGAGESRLHSRGMVLVAGHMRAIVY